MINIFYMNEMHFKSYRHLIRENETLDALEHEWCTESSYSFGHHMSLCTHGIWYTSTVI